MKGNLLKRLSACALCITMACSAVPFTAYSVSAATSSSSSASGNAAFSTDFEDGDCSMFSKRGDSDTSVIKVIEDSKAPSGKKVMAVTGRDQSWNGPSLGVKGVLQPGVKYDISVKVKAQWYNTVCISLQHTPGGSDEPQYTNLVKGVSQGDYVELNTSFSYGAEEKDVSIYVETWGDANDLYIDDFTITPAANNMDVNAPSLKNVYGDMFKFTKALIRKHFNSLTAGNELKPENVLDREACLALAAKGDDENPQVTLETAKPILEFARKYNIPMRGHVLVWHQQTPIWFFKENYDPNGEWRKGLLKTKAILWPYEINSGGNIPGEYEIVYLTPDKMTLVYPDGNAKARFNIKTRTGVTPPNVTTQPKDAEVNEGSDAVFAVTSSGSTPLVCKWQVDRGDGNGWIDLEGERSASITVHSVTKDQDGWQYRCVISNAAGETSSNAAKLTIKESLGTVAAVPETETRPSGAGKIILGTALVLALAGIGGGTWWYLRRRDEYGEDLEDDDYEDEEP